ncbi:MAG: hypothetical protein BWY29_00642 [Microgenomates group bacterium ADurb.Bin238]|uniref:Uncharacterized protein n=1 Tax=Candidatus Chazhemtobacterium aquaticus TaxID=2715735 RepID=A0A857N474_9BACT|nr:hypothetical protein [Candidatus Chazhemtobacterium aquaticus]OQA82886.1 MAG: hypothetical protein BWY29_00642 [Microgenomates group bacterium ADurb.Bin238]QHO63005.1 hypothetical protein MICH65_0024 [Candidatus Chazhemtobacterium aquaticus]
MSEDKGFDARRQHPHPSDDRPFHHDDIPEDDLDAFFDVPEVDIPRRPTPPPIRPRRVETEDPQEHWSNEVRGTPSTARQRQQRRRQPQVPFPANLFNVPLDEYLEKPEWYQNLTWGVLGSYIIAILALLIAIL